MKKLRFWLFPAFVVLILLLVSLGDIVEYLRRPEPTTQEIPLSKAISFVPEEIDIAPVIAEVAEPTSSPWQGLSFGDGWSHAEKNGRWAVGASSFLQFYAADDTARSLILVCRPWIDAERSRSQTITVTVNHRHVDPVSLRPGNHEYSIDIPSNILHSGSNLIEFGYSYHRKKRPDPGQAKLRKLAVFFQRIALVQAPAEKGSPNAEKRADNEAITIVPNENRIEVRQSGLLHIPLYSANTTQRISFGFKFFDAEGRLDSRMTARLIFFDGTTTEILAEKEVLYSLRRLGRLRLNADDRSGLMVLQIKIDLPEESPASVLISAPRVRIRPHVDTFGQMAKAWIKRRFERAPAKKPDIVIAILDAARRDHFGSTYGYHRDTTPNIDRISTTSLAFSQVRAQAPYTHCSVPTMLTGLSFVTHGVVEGRQALSGAETTLAERLNAAGYHTAGFSAAPYNGSFYGTAQGYDEFHELWQEAEFDTNRLASFTSKKVVSWLQNYSRDQPYFLMMHFIPPHHPYMPPPQYDVWGDPDYRGPCDGSNVYLYRARKGVYPVTDADLNELVALYDGNLRAADAALGDIFTAIIRHRRPKNTLLIITSDHGEAFYEHGHQGHSTTLYDEMLRVPLLIRLPGGDRPDSVDLNQPASLEDLSPTVLAAIGLEANPRSRGRDLLSCSEDPDHPRTLVFRTSTKNPSFGVLYGNWKAVFHNGKQIRELFNLADDPEEKDNLAAAHPEVLAMLKMALYEERAATPSPITAAGTEDMTDEQRSMLRELGYIDSD